MGKRRAGYLSNGVRRDEVPPSRPAYRVNSAENAGLGLTATYLTTSWCLLGGIYANYLADSITNSPIVTDRSSRVIFAAVAVLF